MQMLWRRLTLMPRRSPCQLTHRTECFPGNRNLQTAVWYDTMTSSYESIQHFINIIMCDSFHRKLIGMEVPMRSWNAFILARTNNFIRHQRRNLNLLLLNIKDSKEQNRTREQKLCNPIYSQIPSICCMKMGFQKHTSLPITRIYCLMVTTQCHWVFAQMESGLSMGFTDHSYMAWAFNQYA